MVLRLDDKKAIVAEVAAIAATAVSAIATDYRGLTVEQMTALRAKARKSGVYLKVVRNTLACKALAGTSFSCLEKMLTGPLFLAFTQDDPGSLARLLKDALKAYEKLTVKALVLGGQLLDPSNLDKIADLPTREQALAMLASVLQAPLTKLVRTLAEPYAQLARVIAQVRDKKQTA